MTNYAPIMLIIANAIVDCSFLANPTASTSCSHEKGCTDYCAWKYYEYPHHCEMRPS